MSCVRPHTKRETGKQTTSDRSVSVEWSARPALINKQEANDQRTRACRRCCRNVTMKRLPSASLPRSIIYFLLSRSTYTHPSWLFPAVSYSSLFKPYTSFFLAEVSPVAFLETTNLFIISSNKLFFLCSSLQPIRGEWNLKRIVARTYLLSWWIKMFIHTLDGREFDWINEIRYIGVSILCSFRFKCWLRGTSLSARQSVCPLRSGILCKRLKVLS